MAKDQAYREAEQRIEEARQTGATELYLAGMNLTELPEAIASLTQLKVLNLSYNQLTEFPEAIASLTRLQELDLSENQLKELPEAIVNLTKLQQFDLYKNKLTEVPEALANLTQLQELSLSQNQLTEVPEALANLTQLQALNLSYNQLTQVPEAIASLTRLQWLYLQNNQLTELPEAIASLTRLQMLYLYNNQLTELPEAIASLTQLRRIDLDNNQLTKLPEEIANLTQLQRIDLDNNQLTKLPEALASLTGLQMLSLHNNQLTELPDSLEELAELEKLWLENNRLADLPASLGRLPKLKDLRLDGNPLNPDLAAAYKQGTEAVLEYLRAKAEETIALYEAKLILVGEGATGKSSLLGALRGDVWIEDRETTHGVEIKPVKVTSPEASPFGSREIVLNGWDFGGQDVYRPTHQLFFSAPAVYLAIWKPREGLQQNSLEEWLTLIQHRAPEAKVLVIATHGGPGKRQPNIDRQYLRDLFGDMLVDFLHVDSKPNPETGVALGIEELKEKIAEIAAALPEMGREVPAKWQRVREALRAKEKAYISYAEAIEVCNEYGLTESQAELFLKISHTLGHLIHYDYDPILRDCVILKPDWLAKAISFVLDDKETRQKNGIVTLERLGRVWEDPNRGENPYPEELHQIFLRLMERFDLSYRVFLEGERSNNTTSLIAQLVPDERPKSLPDWPRENPLEGDRQLVRVCKIVNDRGNEAKAEGIFYQLIVRLHKYSLGRKNHADSVHWQRGLMLDNGYNGRALLEHIGTNIHITVRAAYPDYFLSVLAEEVKWLVENFWEGLNCEIMVPCVAPCGQNQPGLGLFNLKKLVEAKRKRRQDYPCSVPNCEEWQNIDKLLDKIVANYREDRAENIETTLARVDEKMQPLQERVNREFADIKEDPSQSLSQSQKELASQGEKLLTSVIQALEDEAKDGPRLFSMKPMETGFLDRPKWMSAKFQVTLWCEHSKKPLPILNRDRPELGVYELDLPRKWLVKIAPYLKTVTGALGLFMPFIASAGKLVFDEAVFEQYGEQIDFGQELFGLASQMSDNIEEAMEEEAPSWQKEERPIRAEGAMLREFHGFLKEKDPKSEFGGLVKVRNKRREVLWVHESFVEEY
ncbi:MAG: hypothetical protein F6J93_03360 [Oscillatoria sp. SIO1A7]|nr:hypothetical protein [Oscillatoria sp. SIO1A7]